MPARATTAVDVSLDQALQELEGSMALAVELAQIIRAGLVQQGTEAHRDDVPCIELVIGLSARAAKLVDEMRERRRT